MNSAGRAMTPHTSSASLAMATPLSAGPMPLQFPLRHMTTMNQPRPLFVQVVELVTVLRPHRPRWPAWPSTSSSNTSNSSASQSTLQAVVPDTLDWRTAWILVAHQAAQQERYDKSAFPAQLAEALRQHGMAVRVGRTSTHVMQGIINELTHLQHA
jgi:hypothetical protein